MWDIVKYLRARGSSLRSRVCAMLRLYYRWYCVIRDLLTTIYALWYGVLVVVDRLSYEAERSIKNRVAARIKLDLLHFPRTWVWTTRNGEAPHMPRFATNTRATTGVWHQRGGRQGETYLLRILSWSMFRFTFSITTGPFYSKKWKSLRYEGMKASLQGLQFMSVLIANDLQQGGEVRKDLKLDLRATYYTIQKSYNLYLYANLKLQAPKAHRKPTKTPLPSPKHKDMLRVQRTSDGKETGKGQEWRLRQ
jgi:hypothetical protein